MSVIPFQVDPDIGIQLLDQEISKSSPFNRFAYVDVTFNSVANTDTDIVHALNSTDVQWQMVGWSFIVAPATSPVVYRDTSGTARAWGKNYLILRCNVAGATAKLLLTTARD